MSRLNLEGIRVAITGPRKAEELGRMVEKAGGIPLVRPSQGTVFLEDAEAELMLQRFLREEIDWVIITTGVGLDTLCGIADKMGRYAEFLDKLGKAKVAVRGYKGYGVLKKLNIVPVVRDDDGTTAGLMRMLEQHDLRGCNVALQLHGDPAPRLVGYLQRQGASYFELLPYRHTPPETAALERLTREIADGEVDAVTFTSGPQVRFLFAYAREQGLLDKLCSGFAAGTLAVAVGKYTAECIREEGVERIVVPEVERMGFMLQALADYVEANKINAEG
ncbi:uroporphyrinogen-III synthase [Paenibacillus sp. y28]|uniref:uroporphyrinogen-III synthase n=1 Tax=Paenibacillus sp. y28 TaxID=3129110 RepID=UPI003018FC04